MIHLGDFHMLKENFKVLRLILQCSGFEDLVYQSCTCTSGSLAGVMSEGHYNRSWQVMSESFELALYKRFLLEKKSYSYRKSY